MIKVLLAEDMHMLRGALVALLDLEPDIVVVANVPNGNDVLALARKLRPDVAVLDIGLPGRDGLSIAEDLRTEVPDCRTVILTNSSRPAMVRRALDIRVNAYLLKDSPSERLIQAIREVAAGRRVISNDLALAAWESEESPLSSREIEILRFAADGHRVGEIATSLFLSPGTVSNYLSRVATKLGARNRIDAIRIARDAGWL